MILMACESKKLYKTILLYNYYVFLCCCFVKQLICFGFDQGTCLCYDERRKVLSVVYQFFRCEVRGTVMSQWKRGEGLIHRGQIKANGEQKGKRGRWGRNV